MVRSRLLAALLALPLALLAGCVPADDSPEPSPSVTADPAGPTEFDLAGVWRDTDVVGSNSCDLPEPAPGTSRVTDGIVIEQVDGTITLTAPVNVLGTQAVATGTLADDGSMVLIGTDSGTTSTLTYRAISDSEITGTSQVDTGTCTFDFSNTLTKTGPPE